MGYEVTIFYYTNMLKKWRIAIIGIVGFSMLVSFCLTIIKPPVYATTISLLVTGDNAMGSSIGNILGAANLIGLSNPNRDTIIAIVNSKRINKDIREKFTSNGTSPWFELSELGYAGSVIGFYLTVKTHDPALTQSIADFCIKDLDRINSELVITPNRQMVKVLDPGGYGTRQSGYLLRNVLIAGICSFLAICCYVFFSEYIEKLKSGGSV